MANLDQALFVRFNHLTDDFLGDSPILGASQKALREGLNSINISAGNGIQTENTEEGITLSVDKNAVLTTGTKSQTKSGALTVQGKMTMRGNAQIDGTLTVDNDTRLKNPTVIGTIERDTDYKLHVDGDVLVEDSLLAKDDVLVESDKRVKEDIHRINKPFEILKNVNGYTYVLKKDKNRKRHMGVIAQEVQETMPEVIRENKNGYLSVAYGNMVGVLIEAVKELRAENANQSKEIAELKKLVAKK